MIKIIHLARQPLVRDVRDKIPKNYNLEGSIHCITHERGIAWGQGSIINKRRKTEMISCFHKSIFWRGDLQTPQCTSRNNMYSYLYLFNRERNLFINPNFYVKNTHMRVDFVWASFRPKIKKGNRFYKKKKAATRHVHSKKVLEKERFKKQHNITNECFVLYFRPLRDKWL